jgi:hypothetical protein
MGFSVRANTKCYLYSQFCSQFSYLFVDKLSCFVTIVF